MTTPTLRKNDFVVNVVKVILREELVVQRLSVLAVVASSPQY